jgi:ubiquinone biosynthesis protein
MMALVAASLLGTAGRLILGAILAVVATSVALRLLGARRGWGKAALAGLMGWGVGIVVAVGLAQGSWTGDGLWVHAVLIGVPATMAAAVTLDLLARPGSLATAGRAGIVVTPRPLRALRSRAAVVRRFTELRRLASAEGIGLVLSSRRRDGQHLDPPGVRLRRVLEQAGGVYVKLGQLAATRPDLVPPDIRVELAALQNRVAAEPAERIRSVLAVELGCDPDDVFAEFDWEPLAAASIAQTYTARLHTGEGVVVKVQRPDIATVMERDLAALALLARFAERRTLIGRSLGSADLLAQFATSLRAELDFRREADVMEEMAVALGDDVGVRIPRVHRPFCSRRVLVQERFEGATVADLERTGTLYVQRRRLAETLLRSALDQIQGAGVFHADPHPGNVFLLSDGSLGLIDFGSVGRLDPLQQAAIGDMMLGLARRDIGLLRDGVERVADVVDTSTEQLERALARLVADHVRPSGSINAAVMQDLIATLGQFGIRVDGELVVLARAFATLDGTLRVLCPDFSLVAAATRMMAESTNEMTATQHIVHDEVLAALPHLRRLPERVDRILTLTGRGDLRLHTVVDEDTGRTLRTLANRALLVAIGATFLVAALVSRGDSSGDLPGLTLTDIVTYGGLFAGTVLLVRVVAAVIRDGTT